MIAKTIATIIITLVALALMAIVSLFIGYFLYLLAPLTIHALVEQDYISLLIALGATVLGVGLILYLIGMAVCTIQLSNHIVKKIWKGN